METEEAEMDGAETDTEGVTGKEGRGRGRAALADQSRRYPSILIRGATLGLPTVRLSASRVLLSHSGPPLPRSHSGVSALQCGYTGSQLAAAGS